MRLNVFSLSTHNLHLLSGCVLFILTFIWNVITALTYAAVRRDSVSLIKISSSPSSASSDNNNNYYYYLIFYFIFGFSRFFTRSQSQTKRKNALITCILFVFVCATSIGWYFSITLMSSYVKSFFFLHFIVAGTSSYLFNVSICPFLVHTKGSHYYRHDNKFNVPHFLNFYFQYLFYQILCLICYYLPVLTHQLEGMFFSYNL